MPRIGRTPPLCMAWVVAFHRCFLGAPPTRASAATARRHARLEALPALQFRYTACQHLDRVGHQLESSNELGSLSHVSMLGRHEKLDRPASTGEYRIEVCVRKHYHRRSHFRTFINVGGGVHRPAPRLPGTGLSAF